jgi:hypothetical protein
MQYSELINTFSLYAHIPNEQIQLFESFITTIYYSKSEFLVNSVTDSGLTFILTEGIFRIFIIDKKGSEHNKNFLVAG